MRLSRAQKKAKLEQAAAELIEALLDWDEENRAPTLSEIEDEVLLLRQRFGQEMATTVLAGQEQGAPVTSPACSECGRAMRGKGKKGRGAESRLGELKLERGYYYCDHCGRGIFPPGQTT